MQRDPRGPYGSEDCYLLQLLNAHQLTNHTRLTGRHTAGKEDSSEASIAVADEDDFLCNCRLCGGRSSGPGPAHRPVTLKSKQMPSRAPICKHGLPPARRSRCDLRHLPWRLSCCPRKGAGPSSQGNIPTQLPRPPPLVPHLSPGPLPSQVSHSPAHSLDTSCLGQPWGPSRNTNSSEAPPHLRVQGPPTAPLSLPCWLPSSRLNTGCESRAHPAHEGGSLADPQARPPGWCRADSFWEGGGTGVGLEGVPTWAPGALGSALFLQLPPRHTRTHVGLASRRLGPQRADRGVRDRGEMDRGAMDLGMRPEGPRLRRATLGGAPRLLA